VGFIYDMFKLIILLHDICTSMITPSSPQRLLNWLCHAFMTLWRQLSQCVWTWFTNKPGRPCKPWLHPVNRKANLPDRTHWRSKPDWVREAVLNLACELPGAGYRTIAHCFNLQQIALQDQNASIGALGVCQHEPPASVSKSYVAYLLRNQRAQLAQAHLQAQTNAPKREPILTTWGTDLTGLPLTDRSSVPVFGVIDHGSRALLALQPVARYNSLVLLGKLLIAMGTYGKPRAVRSDNDAVFKTLLFRFTLKVLGVRQQFTDVGCPWQNGRIERFWRTLKEALQTQPMRSRCNGICIYTRIKFASVQAMDALLGVLRYSYNAYRPHQSLRGLTPAMVWDGQVAVGLELKRPGNAATPRRTHRRAVRQRAPPA
jgi:putative transposase